MKKSELKIGNRYTVQTDADQVDVRLIGMNETGGYYRCARLSDKRIIVVRRLKDFLEEIPSKPTHPCKFAVDDVLVSVSGKHSGKVVGVEWLADRWVVTVLDGNTRVHGGEDYWENTSPAFLHRTVVVDADSPPRENVVIHGRIPGTKQDYVDAGFQQPGTVTSPQKGTVTVTGLQNFSAKMREHSTRVPGCTGPHVIIRARAGTGKTTTMIEGLRELKGFHKCRACNGAPIRPAMSVCHVCNGTGEGRRLIPMPQQQAVWDSICLSKDARSICMVAFNKSIAEELKRRVPPGVDTATIHSMGYRAVKAAFPNAQFKEGRLKDVIGKVLGKKFGRGMFEEPCAISAVLRLASLCKLNLIPMSEDDAEDEDERMYRDAILCELADYHGIELGDADGKDWSCRVCELVPKVVTLCRDIEHDQSFDHDDMVWLPIARGLNIYRYDLLFVDEAQDLNRCQQAFVKAAGHRLIFCGDDRQAIYGFAGSDAESIATLDKDMGRQPRGCVILPLTVTRRCGKAIVQEARKEVPDFEAHDANPPGIVRSAYYGVNGRPAQGTYHAEVQQGDMILCRVTAPLVSQCLTLLNQGRYATIQGRDMVSGLRSLAEKCSGNGGALEDYPGGFLDKLMTWRNTETKREDSKPEPSMNKLVSIQDRFNCLVGFYTNFIATVYEGQDTATHVAMSSFLASIDAVFSEQSGAQAIKLSTIHRAKGLESRRVFFLMPDRAECPHPLAKKDWQKQQERNLLYVAITRAIEELVYVR